MLFICVMVFSSIDGGFVYTVRPHFVGMHLNFRNFGKILHHDRLLSVMRAVRSIRFWQFISPVTVLPI
jgi:hypothetical protein